MGRIVSQLPTKVKGHGPYVYVLRDKNRVTIRSEHHDADMCIVQDVYENDCYKLADVKDVKSVVDVGAHIGLFSVLAHKLFPQARILACECNPENTKCLTTNVHDFAQVLRAAITYEKEIVLLNSVFDGSDNTGGSTIVSAHWEGEINRSHYWKDTRSIRTLTLEQVLDEFRVSYLDVLKLDCEGSELSILANTTSLDRLGLIVGEWHGRERFIQLLRERFNDWHFRLLRPGDLGNFWLVNPNCELVDKNRLTKVSELNMEQL